jgi:sugar lactone lactonase YvrE
MGKILSLLIAAWLVLAPGLGNAATPSSVIAFDPLQGQLPESIAADASGNLYVSIGATIVKVDAAGTPSTLASLPTPAGTFATGVKFGPDGALYVASGSFDPTLDVAGVWRVSPTTGDVTLVANLAAGGFPNDIAFDRSGRIYVTDSFLGRIWRIDQAGNASVWLSDPALNGNPSAPVLVIHAFGANGIAFDESKRTLYVSNTDFGTILAIPLMRNGSPGELEVAAQSPLLSGADGIAFDVSGTLFVAVDWQDRIASLDRGGHVKTVFEGAPLDGPSGLAFGVRPCDRLKLYISNFAINRVSATQPGTPHPGILSMHVQRPGLLLP